MLNNIHSLCNAWTFLICTSARCDYFFATVYRQTRYRSSQVGLEQTAVVLAAAGDNRLDRATVGKRNSIEGRLGFHKQRQLCALHYRLPGDRPAVQIGGI